MVVCTALVASSSHLLSPLITPSLHSHAYHHHHSALSLSFPSSSSSPASNSLRLLASPHIHSFALLLPIPTPRLSFTYRARRCRLGFDSLTRAAALYTEIQGDHDPELRLVLELATDAELYELERILFGPSYFSPLVKSIGSREDSEYVSIGENLEERESFISLLESRFLFLAADARSTLRGWRPSYRDALLAVRKKLRIPCSSKLATEDLEIEIFLHLLRDYSSEESETSPSSNKNLKSSDPDGGLELGLSQWKVLTSAAFKGGAAELKSLIFKGGTMFTLGKIYQLLSRRLSGKLFFEAANYQMKNTIVKKGGQLAFISLESRAALLAAEQGFAGAATSYLGLRTMMYFLGPVIWGTLLADVVIQMLGTDYARILRAIYAFAQIRILRTYNLSSDDI